MLIYCITIGNVKKDSKTFNTLMGLDQKDFTYKDKYYIKYSVFQAPIDKGDFKFLLYITPIESSTTKEIKSKLVLTASISIIVLFTIILAITGIGFLSIRKIEKFSIENKPIALTYSLTGLLFIIAIIIMYLKPFNFKIPKLR